MTGFWDTICEYKQSGRSEKTKKRKHECTNDDGSSFQDDGSEEGQLSMLVQRQVEQQLQKWWSKLEEESKKDRNEIVELKQALGKLQEQHSEDAKQWKNEKQGSIAALEVVHEEQLLLNQQVAKHRKELQQARMEIAALKAALQDMQLVHHEVRKDMRKARMESTVLSRAVDQVQLESREDAKQRENERNDSLSAIRSVVQTLKELQKKPSNAREERSNHRSDETQNSLLVSSVEQLRSEHEIIVKRLMEGTRTLAQVVNEQYETAVNDVCEAMLKQVEEQSEEQESARVPESDKRKQWKIQTEKSIKALEEFVVESIKKAEENAKVFKNSLEGSQEDMTSRIATELETWKHEVEKSIEASCADFRRTVCELRSELTSSLHKAESSSQLHNSSSSHAQTWVIMPSDQDAQVNPQPQPQQQQSLQQQHQQPAQIYAHQQPAGPYFIQLRGATPTPPQPQPHPQPIAQLSTQTQAQTQQQSSTQQQLRAQAQEHSQLMHIPPSPSQTQARAQTQIRRRSQTQAQEEAQTENRLEHAVTPSRPISRTMRWGHTEDILLTGAVFVVLARQGSLFPRERRGGRDGYTKQCESDTFRSVAAEFEKYKVLAQDTTEVFPERTPKALARHFKQIKRKYTKQEESEEPRTSGLLPLVEAWFFEFETLVFYDLPNLSLELKDVILVGVVIHVFFLRGSLCNKESAAECWHLVESLYVKAGALLGLISREESTSAALRLRYKTLKRIHCTIRTRWGLLPFIHAFHTMSVDRQPHGGVPREVNSRSMLFAPEESW